MTAVGHHGGHERRSGRGPARPAGTDGLAGADHVVRPDAPGLLADSAGPPGGGYARPTSPGTWPPIWPTRPGWPRSPSWSPPWSAGHRPANAPAHLRVSIDRLRAATRDETLLVISPAAVPDELLERINDVRRTGATILALDRGDPELGALAHEALAVPGGDLAAVLRRRPAPGQRGGRRALRPEAGQPPGPPGVDDHHARRHDRSGLWPRPARDLRGRRIVPLAAWPSSSTPSAAPPPAPPTDPVSPVGPAG